MNKAQKQGQKAASDGDAQQKAQQISAKGTANAGFADVLRTLDRLPLTDAERAEAVRRLLAGDAAKGDAR